MESNTSTRDEQGKGDLVRKLLFTAESLEKHGRVQQSQVRQLVCFLLLLVVTCMETHGMQSGLCMLQMAYMDLSLYLAAECASDKANILFTERLRHDCQAALIRLQCSPTTVQQR